MSELSSGLLYQTSCAESVNTAFETLGFIEGVGQLNERWSLVKIAFEFFFAIAFSASPPVHLIKETQVARKQILSISHQIPLLLFFNAEDQAWGYRIFDKGEVIASFEVDYGAIEARVQTALQAAYPGRKYDLTGQKYTREEYETARVQVYVEGAWREQVITGMRNANPQAFARFGFSPEIVEELNDLLQPEKLADALRMHPQLLYETAERVIEVLNIEDLRFKTN